jgi:ABC-2 type transport system ATP-binding protein
MLSCLPMVHIYCRQLTKDYRQPGRRLMRALDAVSFSIQEGEILGYIGQNGAGKSTTVKLLSGILVPTSGEVSVLGKIPWKHRIDVARQIGVVFGQKTQLWWDLPVRESFDLLKKIYRIPEAAYRATLDSLVQTLDLEPLFPIPVRQLSLGQRMRCDLAASLLHSPSILFLDEPTIGLDAVSKLAVRDFIRHLNREKKVTVLLTTHDMDDIEALCKRILVLHQGKVVFDDSLPALRRRVSPEKRIVVDLEREQEEFWDLPGLQIVKRDGHRFWLSFNPNQVSPPEAIRRITERHAITDLTIENPPIEEIVAAFYRGTPS